MKHPGLLERRGLGGVARAVGAASFFADVCQGIAGALLPGLVTVVFGAPAGALGVIEGVSDGAGGAARLFGGALSGDVRRRRTVAIGGYAGTAMCLSALGLAPGVAAAGAFRVGGVAAFNARIPARNSMLADSVPAGVVGRAFGFERTMAALGAIAGPVAAIGLLHWLGIRRAIGMALVPGLLATACIAWAAARAPGRCRRGPAFHLPVRRVLDGPARHLLLALAPFELGRVGSSFLVLRATEVLATGHPAGRATQAALALLAAHNALGAIVAAPAGRLCDGLGPRRVLLVGMAATLGGTALLAGAGGGTALLVGGLLVVGAGDGILQPAVPAAVARAVHGDLRAAAFGLVSGLQGAANLVAGVCIGLVWSAVSPEAALAYAAVCAGLALAILARSDPTGARPTR